MKTFEDEVINHLAIRFPVLTSILAGVVVELLIGQRSRSRLAGFGLWTDDGQS